MIIQIITLCNRGLLNNCCFYLQTANKMNRSVNPWRLLRGLRALSRGLQELRTAGASETVGQHYLGDQSQ